MQSLKSQILIHFSFKEKNNFIQLALEILMIFEVSDYNYMKNQNLSL